MDKKDILNKLSPAEIISLMTKRQSPIDSSKGMDDLTVGDLMVMQHNPDILEQYKADRRRKLLSESPDEEDEEITVDDLIRLLYGRKDG